VVGFRFEDGGSAPASGVFRRDFEFERVEATS